MEAEFYKKLKIIITLQEKIEELNEKIKQIKETKAKLEKQIIPIMDRDLREKSIKYKDRKIYVKNERAYTNLSYKYLNDKLNKFFKNEKPELVDKICLFLKDERDIKVEKVLHI